MVLGASKTYDCIKNLQRGPVWGGDATLRVLGVFWFYRKVIFYNQCPNYNYNEDIKKTFYTVENKFKRFAVGVINGEIKN